MLFSIRNKLNGNLISPQNMWAKSVQLSSLLCKIRDRVPIYQYFDFAKLNFRKLSVEERKWLKKIAEKSDLLKNPKPQRGRR